MIKNIINVLTANVAELIVGILASFMIPMVVSIGSYAQIKTYSLYISYIGILSLGYYDGLYMRYGGVDFKSIDKQKLNSEIVGFFVMQFAITMVFATIGLILGDTVILLFSISIIPVNVFTCFKRVYQATGIFSYYKKSMLVYSLLNMLFTIYLVVIVRNGNYILYFMITIVASVFAVIYNFYIFYFRLNANSRVTINSRLYTRNIRSGYLILVGNLAVNAIYGIDRWFAKIFFSNTEFAYYSFAVSMLNIIMVLIQSVGLTFYNYLSKTKDKGTINEIKNILIFLGVLSSGTYFGIAIIVNKFIGTYSNSLGIISISFAAYPFIIVINTIFLNWYKADKKNGKYLTSVLFMVILSMILDYLFSRSGKLSSIAIATFVSFVLWYIYCEYDALRMKIKLKEVLYLLFSEGLFLFLASSQSDIIMRGAIYYLLVLLISVVFYGKEFRNMFCKYLK